MIKKLTKHGDSWALVLDQPVLDELDIDSQTSLEISTSGQSLIVTPINTPSQELQSIVGEIERKHAKALKRLAE